MRIVVLALAFACLLAAPLALVSPAHAASVDYGSLSRKYETGGDPTAADSYWGYGAYQMLADTAYEYAAWLAGKSNATYKSWGKGLQAAHKKDSGGSNVYFNAMWRYVAGTKLSKLSTSDKKRVKKVLKSTTVKAGSRAKALSLQYDYTIKVYYKPALKYWKRVAPKFKEGNYTRGLRSVIFSIAVANGPYGSAYSIFKPALKTIGGWKKVTGEKQLIRALYNERSKVVSKAPGSPAYKIKAADAKGSKYKKLAGKYLKHYYSSSSAVQVAVYKRFRYDEKKDALKLLSTCQNCKHKKTTGGKVTKYYGITDASHWEKRTAKTCTTCGKVIAKAGSYKVENVYVAKGTEYQDASGRSFTVHEAGYYAAGSSGAVLRKTANASAKSLSTIAAKKVVKVTEAKLGDDGFWWGKTKRSKKTGWVRMDSLGKLGTASAHVYDSKGACKYCEVTKARAKAMARIVKAAKSGKVACVFAREGSSYKAAYAIKSQLSKKHAAGAAAEVSKVVKNVYGDYWARLSDGSYVNLELLK